MFKVFAEYVKLYLAHENTLRATYDVSVLQRVKDLLIATGAACGLKMNADKCVVLRFGPIYSNPSVPGDSLQS